MQIVSLSYDLSILSTAAFLNVNFSVNVSVCKLEIDTSNFCFSRCSLYKSKFFVKQKVFFFRRMNTAIIT